MSGRRPGRSMAGWHRATYVVRLALLCPAGRHELAALSRLHEGDEVPRAGRILQDGLKTNMWADGCGNELLGRAGCQMVADGEDQQPRKVIFTCATCHEHGERQVVQRTWANLLKLLDAAEAAGAPATRVALRD